MNRSVRRASRMRATRRLLPGVILVVAGLAAAPAALAAVGVNIAGFTFDPATVTVRVGEVVTWTNSDAVSHSATGDGGSFDTGILSAGRTSSPMRFGAAGTYPYHCRIHSAMHGTVVVVASTKPPPTDTLDSAASTADGGPWAMLGLAALGGLVLGNRRFGRVARAAARD